MEDLFVRVKGGDHLFKAIFLNLDTSDVGVLFLNLTMNLVNVGLLLTNLGLLLIIETLMITYLKCNRLVQCLDNNRLCLVCSLRTF